MKTEEIRSKVKEFLHRDGGLIDDRIQVSSGDGFLYIQSDDDPYILSRMDVEELTLIIDLAINGDAK